jgi:hypothetical protein
VAFACCMSRQPLYRPLVLFVKIFLIIALHPVCSSVFSPERSQTAVFAAVVSWKSFKSGRYSSVGIVASLRARPRNHISIAGRSNVYFLFETSRPTLVRSQLPVQCTWALLIGG